MISIQMVQCSQCSLHLLILRIMQEVSLIDPVNSHSDIEDLVSSGYIVRTRADSGGEEADNNDTTRLIAALTSGAHSISTDYPAKVDGIDYWVEIPEGIQAVQPCIRPPSCTSAIPSWSINK